MGASARLLRLHCNVDVWVFVRPVRACVFARPTRTVHMVGMCVPAADDMMKPLMPALSEGVGGYNNNHHNDIIINC